MAKRFLTRQQTNYLQDRLKLLGENTITLAAKLKVPWSTVAGTINGTRSNAEVRQAIANFLGETVDKLFGDNGEGRRVARKFLAPEQTNYIQGHLKLRGEDTVTLAIKLKLPWSTVASAINGYRANPKARQAIADFLGEPVEKLFGIPESGAPAGEGPQAPQEDAQVKNLGHQDEAAHV